MIDTHCHLTSKSLYDQVDAVVDRAAKAGVDRMITVATSLADSRLTVALAHRFEQVFATVGIHPHEASRTVDKGEVVAVIRNAMDDPRVVAIGEMGLDNHYHDVPKDLQRQLFSWQLEVAVESTKPIIIHNREATDEVIKMISTSGIRGDRFVFHCFTGNRAELDAILDLGAMVSFTGIVTFKNARSLAQCAVNVPMDRIMAETDSPYLTPEPHRKIQPNEPCYVPLVYQFLAGVRNVDQKELVSIAECNAEKFFQLGQ